MGRLGGRVAIVTGAAHGDRAALGSYFAKALAREGAKVVAADVKDCTSVVAEISSLCGRDAAMAVHADVRDEKSVAAMVVQTVARYGRLDILVNNAAAGSNIDPIATVDLDIKAWDEIMATNVRGPFLCIKAAIPAMRQGKYGKIINVGSTTSMFGLPDRLHYVTAKGAIHAMTRALAREIGPSGIRVNTIAYGLITNPVAEADFKAHPGKREMMMAKRALGRDVFGVSAAMGIALGAKNSKAANCPRRIGWF